MNNFQMIKNAMREEAEAVYAPISERGAQGPLTFAAMKLKFYEYSRFRRLAEHVSPHKSEAGRRVVLESRRRCLERLEESFPAFKELYDSNTG